MDNRRKTDDAQAQATSERPYRSCLRISAGPGYRPRSDCVYGRPPLRCASDVRSRFLWLTTSGYEPHVHDMSLNSDVTRRAFRRLFPIRRRQTAEQPSGETEHDGHRYVVLHNVNGTLAVYRVLNNGPTQRSRPVDRVSITYRRSGAAHEAPSGLPTASHGARVFLEVVFGRYLQDPAVKNLVRALIFDVAPAGNGDFKLQHGRSLP